MDKSRRTELLVTSQSVVVCTGCFFLGAGPGSPASLCGAGLPPSQLRVMEQIED